MLSGKYEDLSKGEKGEINTSPITNNVITKNVIFFQNKSKNVIDNTQLNIAFF